MKRLTDAKLKSLEQQVVIKTAERTYKTVFGIVDPKDGLLYSLEHDGAEWIKSDHVPDVYISAKMEKALTSKKRFVVIVGGRGSSKSLTQASIDVVLAKDLGYKIYELREFQNSLEDSVHSLLQSEIERLGFSGFTSQNNIIFHESGGEFKFKGLARNPASIKSAANFNRFVVEEAATLSEDSIKHLTPTARNKAKAGLPSKFATEQLEESEEDALKNVQIVFLANPASSADPFSQRFIVPFLEHLERDGFYEDDLHTIIMVNYYDNPWFEDSGLEAERKYDEENLPYASYKHIWLGGFNDHVDNALIPAEWFNAAIDAHKKLNFAPRGAIVAAHDPSDQGDDAKGYALRQGSVVREVKEILHKDAYDGCADALGYCFADNADYFVWDGDGLGATLRNHITNLSAGKKTILQMFKGSEQADNPDAIYSFDNKGVQVRNAKTNKDKRAQYYWSLRDRFYATYRAVVHGEYTDPDMMISLCSEGVENMDKLRSEVCRVPLKNNNNGYIQIMSKIEMKAIKIPSPNMADALMMSFANQAVMVQNMNMPKYIPRPLQTMGRR
jgi:phage terminase large subunit